MGETSVEVPVDQVDKGKRNVKRILIVLVAVLMFLVLAVTVVFSLAGGPKKELLTALEKTLAQQQEIAANFEQEHQHSAASDPAASRQGNFQLTLTDISGLSDPAYEAMLKGSQLSCMSRYDEDLVWLDVDLNLLNQTLFQFDLYTDQTDLGIACSTLFSSAYYVDLQTFEQDLEASDLAKQLTVEEQATLVQELSDFRAAALSRQMPKEEKEAPSELDIIVEDLKMIGLEQLKEANIHKAEGIDGKTNYILDLSGKNLNQLLQEWLYYFYLESPFEATYRQSFASYYDPAASDSEDMVIASSYEDLVRQIVALLMENFPEIDHTITFVVNEEGLIESYQGVGTLVDAKGLPYDFDEITLQGVFGDEMTCSYQLTSEQPGAPNIKINYKKSYQEEAAWFGEFLWQQENAYYRLYYDIGLIPQKEAAKNNYRLAAGMILEDTVDGRMALTVDFEENGLSDDLDATGEITYDAGGTPIIMHLTATTSGGELTEPIAIPEQSKNLFMMSEDELNALSEEISGNIEGLAYQLLGAMMGNEAF